MTALESITPAPRLARVHVRWMIRRDMVDVLAIESASYGDPWSEADFLSHLRRRHCIGMVAEHGKRIVGFMIYELHDARIAVLNFAVSLAHRRRGVGRQMAGKLADKLSGDGRTAVELACHEGNLGAHLFWRAAGFRAVGVEREFYENTMEDAYLFRYGIEDREAGR